MRHPGRFLAAAALAGLVAVPLVGANHTQPVPLGGTISFQDKTGGNEWWVEAVVHSSITVSKVEVMDTGGPWSPMAYHADWGSWAANYHTEPGHQVMFRATTPNGIAYSCWFTHPAAVEQCGTPPPPAPAWTTTGLAPTLGWTNDMAVGDGDHDGHRDVTLASSGGVQFVEWNGTAWASERLGNVPSANAVAVGNAGTGIPAVYVVSGSNLVQYNSVPGGWAQNFLMTFPENYAGDMTLGDIDGLPGTEIYVGMTTTTFDANGLPYANSTIYHVRFTDGVVWESQPIVHFFGGIDSMWIGDGDRDGTNELYVGHGTRHAATTSQVKLRDGTWTMTQVGGTGSTYGTSYVVAGDGDRDGKGEVYSMSDQTDLRRSVYANGAWTQQSLLWDITDSSGYTIYPRGLFLGDGDADGSAELYYGGSSGEIVQVRFDGTAWKPTVVVRQLADPAQSYETRIVLGDVDANGKPEVYAATGHELWQVAVPGAFAPNAPVATTFSSVRGNEWWVQAKVASSSSVAKVEVAVNGGAWQPLAKQSWGGWGASYHMVQGTIVRLRAISGTGATAQSECYQWIPAGNTDAAKVACPGTTQTGFDAQFSGVQGNEWWVQANVAANQGLAGVDARVNCGTWVPLAHQSWGGWAKSIHVSPGAKVDFRARSVSGATDGSGAYLWPNATATTAC